MPLQTAIMIKMNQIPKLTDVLILRYGKEGETMGIRGRRTFGYWPSEKESV